MIRSIRIAWVLSCLSVGALGANAPAASAVEAVGVLNDTGQVACYDESYNAVPCDEATSGDPSPYPRPDGRFGRDAAAARGTLHKIGGGEAGFDFTRICANGDIEGQGSCPLSPPVPQDLENPAPSDWACLRDNVTGLTWTLGNPVQATWVDASSTADGSFIQRANASARCGLDSGWRLPARREGVSLSNAQRLPPNSLDSAYFPILGNNTLSGGFVVFWSTDPAVWHGMFQWTISFGGLFQTGGMQCREVAPPSPCDELMPGLTAWTAGVLLVNGAWRQAASPEGRTQRAGERWDFRNDGLVVTDLATGLTWDRCSWGQAGPGCDGEIAIFPRWADGMDVARIANARRYKGYYDWRLPNVREIQTLVKTDANPAFDATVFPNTLHIDSDSYYWTSSQLEYVLGWSPAVYTIEFSMGVTRVAEKVSTLPPGLYPNIAAVRLVRSGASWDAYDGVSEHLFWADFDSAPRSISAGR